MKTRRAGARRLTGWRLPVALTALAILVIHCHVSDHLQAGMLATYTLAPL